MPVVLLKNSVKEQIHHECIQKKPNEACGFVWGTLSTSFLLAEAFTPIPNCAPNPSTQFLMDPVAMIPLLTNNSESSLELLGILHSHPSAPATPSHDDLSTYWDKLPSHWIVSLQQPTPYIAAYQYFHLDNVDRVDVADNPAGGPSCIATYRSLPITLVPD
jgi:proteasome lid subunit RPN8/RPN11